MHRGFILLNCDLGAEERILKDLSRMDGIASAHMTFGAYDVIAEVRSQTQESFESTIADIRLLPSVVSTMTLNVLDS